MVDKIYQQFEQQLNKCNERAILQDVNQEEKNEDKNENNIHEYPNKSYEEKQELKDTDDEDNKNEDGKSRRKRLTKAITATNLNIDGENNTTKIGTGRKGSGGNCGGKNLFEKPKKQGDGFLKNCIDNLQIAKPNAQSALNWDVLNKKCIYGRILLIKNIFLILDPMLFIQMKLLIS